jgi:hypothetical protein
LIACRRKPRASKARSPDAAQHDRARASRGLIKWCAADPGPIIRPHNSIPGSRLCVAPLRDAPRPGHTPAFSRSTSHPSSATSSVPRKAEGAGNAGAPMHPQPRVRKQKAHERSHHRFTGQRRHSLRDGFNGFLRALPGDRAFLSPSPTECAKHSWPAWHRRRDARTTRLRRPL